jgi:hypothetical protein
MAGSIVSELNRRIFSSRCVGADAPTPAWAKMTKDAQQSFRFLLIINGFHPIYISQVARPGYTVETEQHRLLNWHFHYPTNIKWDDVSFTVKEVYSHSNANTFMKKLKGCVWAFPDETDNERLMENDISKSALVNSLGVVKIQTIRPDSSVHEEWTLEGAFIKAVKFSELNYANEDINSAQVTLSYDWANLKVFPKTGDNIVSVNY